jgi:hypothetical protein
MQAARGCVVAALSVVVVEAMAVYMMGNVIVAVEV